MKKKEVFAWCMFDFANSAYTTIIITAVYSAFFAAKIAGGGTQGDHLWATTMSLSYLLVVLTAPMIGAVADFSGAHKSFLGFTYGMCVFTTALLFFAKPGGIAAAMVLVIVSNWAFALSENMISSFLPHLADEKNIGKISGYGWSLGYMGGLLSLACCLGLLEFAKTPDGYPDIAIRATCLITAWFFFLAGLPTMLWLRQRGKPMAAGNTRYLTAGFARLLDTFKNMKQYKDMAVFMLAFFFFSGGIATVISFAAIFGQAEFGFHQSQLILLIIVVNLTSAAGAFAFGFFQDRTSAKTTLAITLCLWIGVVVWAFSAKSQAAFWGIANLAGIAIGASQSSSRALVGLFAPKEKQAEFFGFWGFFGKAASIVGIYSFGFLTLVTGSRRVAILSTGAMFLVGLLLLLAVNEERGKAAAR